MKDKIIEILYKNCMMSTKDRERVAKEIEKLYEPKEESRPYNKSKFKIFPTWRETKEVNKITKEDFMDLINHHEHFCDHAICSTLSVCESCALSDLVTKADIIKWMEETR
jgi:hypothetical protein